MRLASLGIVAIVVGACGGDPAETPDAPVDPLCGNGVVDAGEDCDFGADNAAGSGCETTCLFSCAPGGTTCDDGDACNGVETCGETAANGVLGHRCVPGSALANGDSCGTNQVCLNGACVAPGCGDGVVTAPEECDDGDQLSGNGCEADCTFSCLSTDATRNCTPGDPCAGQGTCNDTTHICSAGTQLPDDASCGASGYCSSGVCTQPVCGNSDIEPGELCDNGAANPTPGDGCTATCGYECVTPASDCGTAPVCQTWQCSGAHACQAIPDATQDGDACGGGNICNGGNCVSPTAVCGNGVTEAGEQCDFGTAQNGPGTGCETTCQFSCTIAPNSCDDGNACDGVETCGNVTVDGKAGRRCSNGTPPAVGTSCGVNQICLAQTCSTSSCGDGYVHAGAGETCEPPNTATCDAQCHAIASCGDGIRSAPEQCDDGNTTNLDGCHADCKFEPTQRIITMSVNGGTDAICPANALGTAAGNIALTQINDAITLGIADGAITVMFHLLGLDDHTGAADANGLQIGMLSGVPVSGAGYNGANDLDWWYTTDASTITASRLPNTTMSATLAANALVSAPAAFSITVQFVGVPITMSMVDTRIRGTTANVNAPTVATAAAPPGHTAAENLDPSLMAFSRMNTGSICGETIAQSLENVQIAATILQYCSQYTSANTLLDLFVGGCNAFVVIQVIRATQPDGSRTGNDVYRFQTNPTTRRVNACTKNGAAAQLSECLANATYTTYYQFTSDRVIAK